MKYEEYLQLLTKEAKLDEWQATGLLDGIEGEHIRLTTAVLMSNQKLMNEQAENPVANAVEMVAEIVPSLLAHKLVGVLPKLGPNGPVFSHKYKYPAKAEPVPCPTCGHCTEADEVGGGWGEESQDTLAKSRKLKTFPSDDPLEKVVADIAGEIDREIIADLWNNAGTVAAWDTETALGMTPKEKAESLYIKLIELSGVLHRKTLVSPDKRWVVVGEAEAAKFPEAIDYLKNQHRLVVHIVPILDKPGFLLGFRGDKEYETGYVYNPYIMLANTPDISCEGFIPRRGYLIRYGKVLTNKNYYARLVVK